MDSTLLTLLLLVAIAIVLVVRQQVATRLQSTKSKVAHDTNASKGGPNTIYQRLRNMAITTTPSQLGLVADKERPWVFGLVMDYDVGDGMITLTAFGNGDASLLLSSGSGTTGGLNANSVKELGIELVNKAQAAVINAQPTKETPLPESDQVYFYFLTDQGIFSVEELLLDIQEQRSPWLPLFMAARSLVSVLEEEQDLQRAKEERTSPTA